MLAALIATALALTAPAPANNALPLRLSGRTVALTATTIDVTCTTCRILTRATLSQSTAPTPPPLVIPNDDVTAPPLVESDPVTPPRGDLTPPPNVPSWQTAPPEAEPPPPGVEEAPLPKTDLHLNEWVGKEVAVGALALLVTDVAATAAVAALLVVGFGLAVGSGSNASGSVVGVLAILAAFGVAVLHTFLSPLWAAIAVKAISDEPTAQGLGGAALGAYVAAGTLTLVSAAIYVALALATSSTGGSGGGDAVTAVSGVLLIASTLARYIGVPMAASWAMHRGNTREKVTAVPTHPRRFVRVHHDGREVSPLGGATVLRF